MNARVFAGLATAVFLAAAPSRASLTPSETEQVRRGVATATDLGRVRALVARPDLSADEAANAVIVPSTMTAFDGAHVSFFRELVFGDASGPSRPLLVPVVVRGLLARADAVLAQHALDLDRAAGASAELQRVYAFLEEIASASLAMNVPPPARAASASALRDHLARNATLLSPQASVAPSIARVRAQAAVAYLDLMPDAATRRIDAADGLGLTGPRRSLLVERGTLVLDAGAPDARLSAFRSLFDRFLALRDGIEVVVIGSDGAGLAARDGAVIGTGDDPTGADPALLWGHDVHSPPGDAWTTAIARGLALATVTRAIAQRVELRAQLVRDGGPEPLAGVASMAARLAVNGPLAIEAAAARLLAGHKESAASLADAIGALAVFAPPSPQPADGLAIPVGPAKSTGAPASRLTRIVLGPSGAANAFRLEGRTWVFERDASGTVIGLRRDGLPVTAAMLVAING